MYLSIYIQSYIKMFTYGTHHINWSQVPRRRPHYCNSPGTPPLLCVALRWSPLGTAAQGPCGRPGYGEVEKPRGSQRMKKNMFCFSPHWRVFFVFSSVSAPSSRPPPSSLTHSSHTHSLITLTHSHTHTLTHSLAHSASGRMYALASPVSGWQPWDNVHCQRGRMYGLGFGWRPWVSASFAWQAWDNVHCQGVGCTAWGSAGVPGSPPLLRGRRGTMCTTKGSDVRPRVRLASLGLRLFCVAGTGQCALPRGRMYALGFGWRPWVSASFVWQVWDNVHFCVAGVGQCALPRGQCALLVAFAWQAWDTVLTLTHSHSFHHWLTRLITHTLTPSLTRSLTHSLSHTSLTHILIHSPVHAHTCTHTQKLTHHHSSITLLLPLPFLLFYAQSKSREVGDMWGYLVL